MQPTMPEEYRQLLHRWATLASYTQRTPEQDAEMAQVSAEMDKHEEAHRQERNTIALASSDYDQCRAMGDLGGVELL